MKQRKKIQFLSIESKVNNLGNSDISLSLADNSVVDIDKTQRCMSKVVVGEITSIDTIIQSKGLKGVTVDCGNQLYRTVSTADNLKIGMKTAFAKLGALLNEHVYVQIQEIGGVESQGKLCTAFDLGVGIFTEEVIEIQNDVKVGTRLSEVTIRQASDAYE